MPDERPATYDEVISALAKQNGIPPELAMAVAKRESNRNPNAAPGDGGQAIGMFQLHPGAAQDTGTADRSDPIQNITGGIKYLKQLSDRYQGDVSKTLMAYNGGMEGVDAGSPSAAAQAYASDVLAELSQQIRPAATPKFTDESKPIAKGVTAPAPPSTGDVVREAIGKTSVAPGVNLDTAKGFVKKAGDTVTRLGQMVRNRFPSLDRGPEVTFSTTPTNTDQKIGGAMEQASEFMGPSEAVSGLTKGAPLLLKAAGQAASSYGVSKAQGASETGSRVNAALGSIGPVVSEAMPALGKAIRERAVKQLALRLSKGLAEPNPAVEYGLKTGDVSPDVVNDVKIVRQAASDILDAPLRATWGKWMASLGKDNAQKGQAIGKALQGPLGDEHFFKQPIYDELDKLASQSAQHFAEVPGSTGGTSGSRTVTYNPELLKAIDDLKGTLDQYGPMISARNLSNLKRTWDDIIYTLSTSGKVGLGSEALLNSAKKKAVSVGANSIRQIFDQGSPTLDALNDAASNAYRLQDLVQKVFTKQPGMGVAGKVVTGTAGSVGGFLAGQTVGHPYVAMGMGAAMSRALVKAIESPLFQTLSPSIKNELAQAIASGNTQAVTKIVAPMLQASVSSQTKPTVAASSSPVQ